MAPAGARARSLDWRIETLPQATSTNDLVLERARGGAAEGFVIRAESQTAGRGREGRPWFSPPGSGLYFSALLRPDPTPEMTPAMTLLAGVAVALGLRRATGCPVGLKWPNDLRVAGRKIGGILCEYETLPGAPAALAIGVGVNLTTKEAEFPSELRGEATSVEMAGGEAPDAGHLLDIFLERLSFWHEAYQTDGFGVIRGQWLRLCDHGGERISVRTPGGGQPVRGICRGVDGTGRLLIEDAGGVIRPITSGEVEP